MKTTHFCVFIHCSADCWLCLKQFAQGICLSQKIGWKTIEKISITNKICMTIDSPPKIPVRKPDSEVGCIFENFTPKQGNSLKILVAGTHNHGVSLPPPPPPPEAIQKCTFVEFEPLFQQLLAFVSNLGIFLQCPLSKYGHVMWPKKQISKKKNFS